MIVSITLLLSGCNKKDVYEGLEHYDLSTNTSDIRYIYTTDEKNNKPDTYAYAILDPSQANPTCGLLYQTEQDDYVLLGENDCYDTSGTHQDEDKLYIAGFGVTLYKLNKEKTEKEEINLDLTHINKYIDVLYYTLKLDDDFIYFKATSHEKEEWGKELNLKCSLENYTCELDNEN